MSELINTIAKLDAVVKHTHDLRNQQRGKFVKLMQDISLDKMDREQLLTIINYATDLMKYDMKAEEGLNEMQLDADILIENIAKERDK